MSAALELRFDIEQGSPEWHALRKKKVTATDAPIIVGASHWKTRIQLYEEKIDENVKPLYINEAMKRGIELEKYARELFNLKTGLQVKPAVAILDWTMASLDGITEDGKALVEIKCPMGKDHQTALSGKVPDHYFPQLQHQMYVCGAKEMFYFSFDGADGDPIILKRDDGYIEKMIEEESKFYNCMVNKIRPEPTENDYLERSDELWQSCANRWKSVSDAIKELEKEEDELRKQLIFLSGESNTKGGGVSLCQIIRKGNIEYGKIPQLKGVDLEEYRKAPIHSWRITHV